ncbi:MAG TPA: metalloregulator ArsR/SmtB family transcription factor [Candidatus Acidoferrum sp.]|jgi:DNA-binding transcriptional ArsR family regulator|nr:metalloregulator ArsR/SmtB family transcription factor [Candidatus Acidoferrum sp.]
MNIAPSAAFELMWVLHNCGADHVLEGRFASTEAVRAAFGPRLRSFWADGVRGFGEVIVLADRSGSLRDSDMHGFFAGVERAAASTVATPSLLSESSAERSALDRRLEALRTDPKVRADYISLLKEIWSAVRAEWEETGRPAVIAATRDWTKQLAEGVPYRNLLQRTRLWPGRPDLEGIADADAAEGRMVLTPGWFFGDIHVVELDGWMYVGRGIQPHSHDADLRQTANHVAKTMKAFADPTRLAILMWLAQKPASVTEISRQFKLSQPTVSTHVQLLRDAGVIEEKPAGRSSLLSVREESVREVLGGAEEALLKGCRL